ncbi:NADPH-dependent FMN reductase [Nocardiopsis changdeensis]|uniref:NAD(P)H-dependent oxidoreductase n=1 Tax=Nocardiopsis changdeensis TaxID=2831969 RepID=A0ABX8BTX7_9ACTN|nr:MULTISPECIES: NAD(P)H-dependent oxidoreductase [Nocardiopsis]QUX25150.1 NAD(P)H-dependent oxidoreductase [Nocardiopsis changdeensis]QYX35537.1 NAD(P)H-dependent oxidoreductase [Nocardiopsis sp. MT53]
MGSASRLVIIIGSTRKGRVGPVVAEWFAERARHHGFFDVDVIDLAQAWLPDILITDRAEEPPQAVRDLKGWLRAADAFAIVTPEHNNGYPAALKNAIDWCVVEWRTKPVGYVSYGGAAGGLRAVQALQPVLTELGAVNVRETVSLPHYPERYDGGPVFTVLPEHDAHSLALLDCLAWWARTLQDGRERAPYPGEPGSPGPSAEDPAPPDRPHHEERRK